MRHEQKTPGTAALKKGETQRGRAPKHICPLRAMRAWSRDTTGVPLLPQGARLQHKIGEGTARGAGTLIQRILAWCMRHGATSQNMPAGGPDYGHGRGFQAKGALPALWIDERDGPSTALRDPRGWSRSSHWYLRCIGSVAGLRGRPKWRHH